MGRKLLCPLATRIDPPTPFPRPGAHPLLLPANWRFRTILSLHTCYPLLGQRKSCGWEGSRGTGRHPPPLQWGLPRHRCRESEGTGLRGHAPQENKVCARLRTPPACLPASRPSLPLTQPSPSSGEVVWETSRCDESSEEGRGHTLWTGQRALSDQSCSGAVDTGASPNSAGRAGPRRGPAARKPNIVWLTAAPPCGLDPGGRWRGRGETRTGSQG